MPCSTVLAVTTRRRTSRPRSRCTAAPSCAGEQLALANPHALVVRTNFFGWSPTGERSILEFFVNELGAGHAVRGFTDFTVTSAYAPALCGYLDRLVELRATGVLHVTSPDALTKYAFGVAVAEEFGLDPSLITPTTADVAPPRNRDLSLDVSRAQSRCSARPCCSSAQGIARAHADAAAAARPPARLSPTGRSRPDSSVPAGPTPP